jgi:hypothetical protein
MVFYMDITRYDDNYSSVSCFKITTTVSVKSSNKVWVKVRASAGYILYHDDSHYWTSFSGVLVRAN